MVLILQVVLQWWWFLDWWNLADVICLEWMLTQEIFTITQKITQKILCRILQFHKPDTRPDFSSKNPKRRIQNQTHKKTIRNTIPRILRILPNKNKTKRRKLRSNNTTNNLRNYYQKRDGIWSADTFKRNQFYQRDR